MLQPTLEIAARSRPFQGEMFVPSDKSISHRAVMLGALAEGETRVGNFLASEDCLRTVACFRAMGVPIETKQHAGGLMTVRITGQGLQGLKKPNGSLDVGNSGTTIRLLLGILAGQTFSCEITGDASIQRRPMDRVALPLRAMGGEISGQGEKLCAPLKIQGRPLQGITYKLPVASAQVKSALLFAGLFAQGETRIVEPIPTRDHTERMLGYFDVCLEKMTQKDETILSLTGKQKFRGKKLAIPGDFSSAAYFMVAALLVPGSHLILRNVGVNSTRTGLLSMLREMGGNIEIKNEREVCGEPVADVEIYATPGLKGVTVGGALIPLLIDELPILAVAATQAEGETVIKDAKELRVKESDRIATLAAELRKLGAQVEERPDGMVIQGPTPLWASDCDSHGDHRIAMSLAIAGLIVQGDAPTRVINTACIATSFPQFPSLLVS